MPENIVEGEVWINGSKTAAKLLPYFCQYGVWLRNHAGGFDGPHTDINLSSETFAEYLSSDENGEVKVVLNSGSLGKIDECSGYAAVDMGPHSRQIEKLVFSISHSSQCTRFEFEGQTGFLVPNSVSGDTKKDLASLGKYKFRIWFLIPDQETALFFKEERSLQAIDAYVSRQVSSEQFRR